ncbi:MAG TPA: DUF4386 domain-containing protein [Steroidobacteraceae bacterium]
MLDGWNAHAAGRRAGLAYLVIIVFPSAAYLTLSWLLAGDLHMVLVRLATNQTVFMLALVANLIGLTAWVVLGILLYRLMSFAGRIPAVLMLVFIVAGTAMSFMALSALLPLLGAAGSGIDVGTLAPMVQNYNHLLLLAQAFSGLWLFPLGWLILRSRMVPRPLGAFLIIGGVSYLLNFATAFEPDLSLMIAYRIGYTATGILGVFVGEIGLCLWLLFKGAREPDLLPVTGSR